MLRSIFRKPSSRAVKLILLLLLAFPLGTWVVLRASLVVKARRADALLHQVKALRLRESTFQDAKQLADQYDGKVDYHNEPCTFEKCTLSIFLGTWPEHQPGFVDEALRFAGIRAYGVEGSVSGHSGRIVETEFGLTTEAKLGTTEGQWLAAVAKVSDRFPRSDYYYGRRNGLDEHPNRRVIHPFFTTTGGGRLILSEVTADANATETERAFDFRLSCISSLGGCSDLRELAPSAWEDLMTLSKEEGKRVEETRDYGTCSTRSLARIARDMENVLLVEVEKVFPVKNVGDKSQDVKFQLIEVLKGQTDKHLLQFPLEIPTAQASADNRNAGLPSNTFSPGNQLLLFLKEGELDFIPYPHCEVVLASHGNLAVVRRTLTQLAQGAPITALAEGHQLP
jgi:hypothetical protein